uniref:Uncharacterized protein n=1 Tax=Molossus molossus TaxID=27622 RepID=A0A7J8FYA5_MOLMO|nr:hypothetical protein HJG59_008140 [Molossus molossus]
MLFSEVCLFFRAKGVKASTSQERKSQGKRPFSEPSVCSACPPIRVTALASPNEQLSGSVHIPGRHSWMLVLGDEVLLSFVLSPKQDPGCPLSCMGSLQVSWLLGKWTWVTCRVTPTSRAEVRRTLLATCQRPCRQ